MIYFVQAGENGPIKIGYAQVDMKGRFKSLQTANHEELYVLGISPGTQRDEANLHIRFRDYLIRGEWYQPAESLLTYITQECPEKPAILPGPIRRYAVEPKPMPEPPHRAWYDW